MHRHLRTTNHLERLFREFRTKSDEIGAFPNETSCLTLFWLLSSVTMLNMTVETMRIIHDTNVCSLNSSSGIKRIVFRNDLVFNR